MKRIFAAVSFAILAAPAFAESVPLSDSDRRFGRPAGDDLSSGEIRKVDLAARKITIKHGPLRNLDMPAMTMVFRIKDRSLLEGLETGEPVRFQAEKLGAVFIVTWIEPAR